MIIIKSINKLKKEVNFKANIGFVPTMGALHKGHLSLIESSKKKCRKVIVSIFVNPSQFNKINDYKKYPNRIQKDIKILKKAKIDYLFLPQKKEIFKYKKDMRLKINKKNRILCAKFRMGHFEGVLGVVNQLLKLVKAKYMFLGEKDYQQIFLIRNFIKNKFITKIITGKTIRDNNYLPYSSRNYLLKKKELIKASNVSKKIKYFHNLLKKSLKNIIILKKIKNEISDLNVKIEYLEVRNKNDLSKKINKNNFKIFIAYYIKKVRLIDNI